MPVVEDFEHWFQELRWKLRGYQPGGLSEAPNVEYTPSSGPGTSLTAYGSGNFNSSPVSVNDASPFWSVLNGDTISHTFTISMRVNNAVSGQFTLPPGAGVCLPSRVIAAVAIDTPTTAVTWFYSEANVNWSLPKPAPGGGAVVEDVLNYGVPGPPGYVVGQLTATGIGYVQLGGTAGDSENVAIGRGSTSAAASTQAYNNCTGSNWYTYVTYNTAGNAYITGVPCTQGQYLAFCSNLISTSGAVWIQT